MNTENLNYYQAICDTYGRWHVEGNRSKARIYCGEGEEGKTLATLKAERWNRNTEEYRKAHDNPPGNSPMP